MTDNEIVIQSFLPHPLEFQRNGASILRIPAGYDERNIVIADKTIVESLVDDPTFKTACDNHLLKLLNSVPVRYQDQADTLIQVRLALDKANTDKTESDKKLTDANYEIDALKKRIAELEAGKALPGIDPAKLAAAREVAKNTGK